MTKRINFERYEHFVDDCGKERDATFLIHSRNKTWDGHYYQFNPLPGDIINVSPAKQLPTHDIVVNMDGGVGGSWEVKYDEQLPKSDSKPIDLT